MELNDKVSSLKGIGPKKAEILKKKPHLYLGGSVELVPQKV